MNIAPSSCLSQPSRFFKAVHGTLRLAAPRSRDHSLRQVADLQTIVGVQLQTGFFPRLTNTCGHIINIARISSSAWKRNMTGPSISNSSGPLNKEYFKFTASNPILIKEVVNALIKALGRSRTTRTIIRRFLLSWGPDAEDQSYRSSLPTGGRIWDMGERTAI